MEWLQEIAVGLCWRIGLCRFLGQGSGYRGTEPVDSLLCRTPLRGVLEDELLMALPPRYLPKVIAGLAHLSANGLRYPIPQYGIQSDARAGLAVSYGDTR